MADRRRGSEAIIPRERLVRLYLEHGYAADPCFCVALETLYRDHHAHLAFLARLGVPLMPANLMGGIEGVPAAVAKGVAAFGGFAVEWKLDLLGTEGYDALAMWLWKKETTGRESWSFIEDKGGAVGIAFRYDERAPANRITAADFPRMVAAPFLPDPEIEWDAANVEAVVRVDGLSVGTYAPEHETPTKARARLRRTVRDDQRGALGAGINRIAAAWEAVGYAHPDTAKEIARDLCWLYRRVRYRDSCDALAVALSPEDEAGSDDDRHSHNIRERTDALAGRLALTIPRSIAT